MRSFTPESPGSFPLRSSSTRCEGFDLRAEVRVAYPSPVIPQSESLEKIEEFFTDAAKNMSSKDSRDGISCLSIMTIMDGLVCF